MCKENIQLLIKFSLHNWSIPVLDHLREIDISFQLKGLVGGVNKNKTNTYVPKNHQNNGTSWN